MHTIDLSPWQHSHVFGQDRPSGAEASTRRVVVITAVMMVVEVAGGMAFGSMALLADGWHMASHAAGLGISVFAYWYARRRAHDASFAFGTGKVRALGGFGSAAALGVVALTMTGESLWRFASPAPVHFREAIAVAIGGLLVNVVSAWWLRDGGEHAHDHHDHAGGHHHAHDHNLRAAYLHVLADALTSVLAITALLAGKLLGWWWTDPLMGVVGGIVILRWSYALARSAARVLLDADVSLERISRIRGLLESDGDTRVSDLHVWRIAPGKCAAVVSLVAVRPAEPQVYKNALASVPELEHVTIEVLRCQGSADEPSDGDRQQLSEASR